MRAGDLELKQKIRIAGQEVIGAAEDGVYEVIIPGPKHFSDKMIRLCVTTRNPDGTYTTVEFQNAVLCIGKGNWNLICLPSNAEVEKVG